MRSVINISLPQEMVSIVEEHVSSGNYATKSEFFRDLMRMWLERKLILDVTESEREFAAGKGKKLHSLKDLR